MQISPVFKPFLLNLASKSGKTQILLLTYMHDRGILRHMRTTLNIDDELLRQAAKLTGVREKTSLVQLGLEALIAMESARRLAKLAGTEKLLKPIRRRRSRNAA